VIALPEWKGFGLTLFYKIIETMGINRKKEM
jgi:hypothetical protein